MNAESPVTVWILLVDDFPIVRIGIRMALAGHSDLQICSEAETVEEALRTIQTSKVDLAIVELSEGTENGVDLIRLLRHARPGLPVLVYSQHDPARFAELAFNAGADGYVMKREPVDHLVRAIREVLAGRKYVRI
jgi:DNA-binding NarL/FixJ family response regulator